MTAIKNHFTRLRRLLPAKEVDRLEREYKADLAEDNRKSRQRTRLRQSQQRLAREGKGDAQADATPGADDAGAAPAEQ